MFTTTSSFRSTARWIVALPLLMVGSLFFWSLALGLGGISLMRFMALAAPNASIEVESSVDVSDGTSPIMVHLQESADPADVTDPAEDNTGDNTGAGGFVVPDEHATVVPGPGNTSY